MSDAISKASVCEILADIYPTDGEKVVAVKEVDKAYEAIQQLPSVQQIDVQKAYYKGKIDGIKECMTRLKKVNEGFANG